MKITPRGAWLLEEEESLKNLYLEEGMVDPYQLALIFKKNHRSVISKLVQLKIYKKPEAHDIRIRTTKTLLRDIERLLNIEIEGDNIQSKKNLLKIVRGIERLKDEVDSHKEDTLEDY